MNVPSNTPPSLIGIDNMSILMAWVSPITDTCWCSLSFSPSNGFYWRYHRMIALTGHWKMSLLFLSLSCYLLQIKISVFTCLLYPDISFSSTPWSWRTLHLFKGALRRMDNRAAWVQPGSGYGIRAESLRSFCTFSYGRSCKAKRILWCDLWLSQGLRNNEHLIMNQ